MQRKRISRRRRRQSRLREMIMLWQQVLYYQPDKENAGICSCISVCSIKDDWTMR